MTVRNGDEVVYLSKDGKDAFVAIKRDSKTEYYREDVEYVYTKTTPFVGVANVVTNVYNDNRVKYIEKVIDAIKANEVFQTNTLVSAKAFVDNFNIVKQEDEYVITYKINDSTTGNSEVKIVINEKGIKVVTIKYANNEMTVTFDNSENIKFDLVDWIEEREYLKMKLFYESLMEGSQDFTYEVSQGTFSGSFYVAKNNEYTIQISPDGNSTIYTYYEDGLTREYENDNLISIANMKASNFVDLAFEYKDESNPFYQKTFLEFKREHKEYSDIKIVKNEDGEYVLTYLDNSYPCEQEIKLTKDGMSLISMQKFIPNNGSKQKVQPTYNVIFSKGNSKNLEFNKVNKSDYENSFKEMFNEIKSVMPNLENYEGSIMGSNDKNYYPQIGLEKFVSAKGVGEYYLYKVNDKIHYVSNGVLYYYDDAGEARKRYLNENDLTVEQYRKQLLEEAIANSEIEILSSYEDLVTATRNYPSLILTKDIEEEKEYITFEYQVSSGKKGEVRMGNGKMFWLQGGSTEEEAGHIYTFDRVKELDLSPWEYVEFE